MLFVCTFVPEEFGDTKGIIKIRISKDRQHNNQTKKGQTTIYKILHRKLKTEQQEYH
jgi:hypothetical protein